MSKSKISDITIDALLDRGYESHPIFGLTKKLGGEHDAEIYIGHWPFNEFGVSIRIDGATLATEALQMREIEVLEKLLGRGIVDYDHVDQDRGEVCR